MLYVTTRNNQETFTAQRVLNSDRAPDGGFYIPFHDPEFSEQELARLKTVSFHQRIAEILNRLFQTKLDRWDVSFAIGRTPVKLINLRHHIIMGEFWHNPKWSFAQMEQSLTQLLCETPEKEPGNWVRIAIRIAVLAAVCLDLVGDERETVDISAVSGDLLWPISVWYARSWGFPIGNIIVCCNENHNLWDLICHGQMRTDSVSIQTELPDADIPIPPDLERLIYACGGRDEQEKYLDCCCKGERYSASEQTLASLREGLYVSVVSSDRMNNTIPGVLRTHNYLLSPGAALAYAGLLYYRAKKGTFRSTLVITEKSP